MKKVAYAFLTLSFGVILSACSNNIISDKPSEKPEKVTINKNKPEKGASLVLFDNGGKEGEWEHYVANLFTKKYGVPITFVANETSTNPLEVKADVFLTTHDQLSTLKKEKLVTENYFPENYNGKFINESTDAVSVKGKLYGYPISIDTYALYYNKNLVKKVPSTMGELLNDAKNFTSPKERMFGFMADLDNFYYEYSFLSGYGGSIFDGKKVNLNRKEAILAAEKLRNIKENVLPLSNEDLDINNVASLFAEGKIKYALAGSWEIEKYTKSGVNFGVMQIPSMDNEHTPLSFSSVKAYFINNSSKYPIAANLFAKFSTSDEMLLKRYELTGEIPPVKDLVKNNEVVETFLEQADHSTPIPSTNKMLTVWSPMNKALTKIWNTNDDIQTILNDATKEIDNN